MPMWVPSIYCTGADLFLNHLTNEKRPEFRAEHTGMIEGGAGVTSHPLVGGD